MWSQGDTDCPGRAHVIIGLLEIQIIVEDLNAKIVAICNIDVALAVHRNRMRCIELSRRRSARSYRFDKLAVLGVLCDTGVAIAVRDEDIPCGVPSDVGRPIKAVRLGLTSWLLKQAWSRLRTPAQKHLNPAFRIELDYHVRSFIDRPDVILWIDPNSMSKQEPIQALADLANESSVRRELKQVRCCASGKNENMAFRIRRHSNGLAQLKISW